MFAVLTYCSILTAQRTARVHDTKHTKTIRECDIIEGIKRGIADAVAGHLVPHEEAMAEIDALIEAEHKTIAANRRGPNRA
jgi:predicted transcriptional regulator